MWRDEHDMWTDVEVLVWSLGWRSWVRYPGTHVHVGDANPVDVSRSACQTIRDPLHEDARKANNAQQLASGTMTTRQQLPNGQRRRCPRFLSGTSRPAGRPRAGPCV